MANYPENQWLLESMIESLRNQIGRTCRQFVYPRGVTWILCILICLFGLSSWVAINGLWAEMPVLVPVLPEGDRLPSVLVIIAQFANVGPLIYLVISIATNCVKKKRVNIEVPAVFVIVLFGMVMCVLLAIFWDHTSVLFNKTRSVPLLVLSFGLSLVDCTSTVVYIPYMERFPDKYISALFMGEGFGALFPSLVALAQDSYNDNSTDTESLTVSGNQSTLSDKASSSNDGLLFSVDVFFVLLAIMTGISGVAFALLNWLPICRRSMVRRLSLTDKFHPLPGSRDSSPLGYVNSEPNSSENSNIFSDIENSPLILTPQSKKQFTFKDVIEQIKISPRANELISLTDMFIQIGWLNLLTNGAIPAISVFVFQPYGNSTYNLAVNLGMGAGPIAAFVAMFLPCVSRYFMVIWTLISSAFGVTIIILAALAPNKLPMMGSNWGSFIIVSYLIMYALYNYLFNLQIMLSILSTATLTYTKVSIARTLKDYGKASLVLCAISIQAGSCIGAVIFYFLVNNTTIFAS